MKIPFVIFLAFPLTLHAQLKESFEENNLKQWQQFPPERWESSAVSPLHGQYSLHHCHDSNDPGFDRISFLKDPFYLDSLTAVWKFCILHACLPSSQNNWAVYLTADKPAAYMNPDSNINAYVVGVNLDGYDDLLRLYKIKNYHLETIINTGFNWQTGISINHGTRLEITRTTGGKWSVSIDTTGSGYNFAALDDGMDKEFTVSNYTGLGYRYTSSNDRKLWFDDLEITGFFKKDTEPPDIKGVSVISPNRINIKFTEALNTHKLSLALFSVDNEIGFPVAMDIQSSSSISIAFADSFTSTREYEIAVYDIEDLYGNDISILKKKFVNYFVKPYDIVINEIMADPEPAVNLPGVEYIELLNTTDYDIEVQGWELAVSDNFIPLPPFLMKKGTYVIICEARDSFLLNQYGALLPVEGLPALNNEGQTLTLTNQVKDVIHSISYSRRWLNSLKSEGGWSLEMTDPENPCGGYTNWGASDHYLGGTPGFENSLARHNPDIIRPYLLRAAVICDTGLLVCFNESLLSNSATDPSVYSVNQGIFHPSEAVPVPPDFSKVLLSFPARFEPFRLYELMIKDVISDCSGNMLSGSYVDFGLASPPDSFDLIINEVLFDAREDEEFIEIINRSDKIIELSSLKIVLLEEYTGTLIKTLYEITGYFQLLPDQYVVLTGNAAVLQEHYDCRNPAAIVEATGMAVLPDEAGVIALLDNTFKIIDKFRYSSDLHLELITDPEGISLERLHYDNHTNDPENWHSAAEAAGFATPGYKNSQSFGPIESFQSVIWVEPEIFTPDNDGNDDYIALLYRFDNPGYIATVMVFDNRGNLVKQLANNVLLGTEGFLTWDGTNAQGSLKEAGLYLVYTEVFSEHGGIRKYKNTCVLAKKVK